MRTLFTLTVGATLLAGCGGETPAEPAGEADAPAVEAPAADVPAPAEEAPADEAAEPAPGLTKAQLEAHGDHAHGFQPWDKGYEALVGAYGEPMAQEGDTHLWYAVDGEDCWQLSVQDMGGTVGASELKRVPECPE